MVPRALRIFLSLLPLAIGTALHAQTFRGTIHDAITDQPVPSAEVVLVDSTARTAGRATTSADGSFSIPIQFDQPYALRVSAFGYEAFETPLFSISPGDSAAFALILQPSPLALDETVARVQRQKRAEFERRGWMSDSRTE